MVEIDERYKRGMIYTIRNIKDDTMVYVGSTINDLSKRFCNHKKDCKAGVSHINLYKHIENNDWTDWYIELYENYPCSNKKELNRREGEVIRKIGTINKCIAGRTKKEYREDNADFLKVYHKVYRDVNADKIKEYYIKNVEKLLEQKKEYYENNINNILEKRKKYRDENVDKIKEKRKEKICCQICGSIVNKVDILVHKKTKKCLNQKILKI